MLNSYSENYENVIEVVGLNGPRVYVKMPKSCLVCMSHYKFLSFNLYLLFDIIFYITKDLTQGYANNSAL